MPGKKSTEVSRIDPTKLGTAERNVPVRFDEIVRVETRFHVPAIHPHEPGPWADEAEKIAWTDDDTGYPCIIRRSPRTGALHGYVAVEPSHPLYGFDPEELDMVVSAHGPIDYAKPCQQSDPETTSICHSPGFSDGETQRVSSNSAADRMERGDEAWWIGFACDGPSDLVPLRSHSRDLRADPTIGLEERIYRDEAYVRTHCIALARQLKAIEEGRDPTPHRLPSPPIGIDPDKAEG